MTNAYYLRQSLDRDENKLAVGRQREDVLKLCERLGWDNPSRILRRQRQRHHRPPRGLRAAVRRHRRRRRSNASRCGRWTGCTASPPSLRTFMKLVERHGVELANVGGHVDLSTPEGAVTGKDQRQRRRVRDRASSRAARNAPTSSAPEAGKPWVQRSFGYDGNTIVPKEAAAIRKACHALLNGATLWSIAKDWNAKGLKTSKGYLWEGSKVRQLLLRPAIAGLAVHDGEILDGVTPAWKPILDRDTWESVRKYLSDPKTIHRPLYGPQAPAVRHRLLRRMRQAHGHDGQAHQERHETPCLPMQEHGLHEDRARPGPAPTNWWSASSPSACPTPRRPAS